MKILNMCGPPDARKGEKSQVQQEGGPAAYAGGGVELASTHRRTNLCFEEGQSAGGHRGLGGKMARQTQKGSSIWRQENKKRNRFSAELSAQSGNEKPAHRKENRGSGDSTKRRNFK